MHALSLQQMRMMDNMNVCMYLEWAAIRLLWSWTGLLGDHAVMWKGTGPMGNMHCVVGGSVILWLV